MFSILEFLLPIIYIILKYFIKKKMQNFFWRKIKHFSLLEKSEKEDEILIWKWSNKSKCGGWKLCIGTIFKKLQQPISCISISWWACASHKHPQLLDLFTNSIKATLLLFLIQIPLEIAFPFINCAIEYHHLHL